MNKCPQLVPTGISASKYSPFIPPQAQTPFLLRVVSCIRLLLQSWFLLLSLLLTPCLSLPLSLFSLFSLPSPCVFITVSSSLSTVSLPVSLLCTCIGTQTKPSHVGMHVQQICRWLCSSRDELLEQLHSFLIRWHTLSNQNHSSAFPPPSLRPGGKWKLKRPVLCNFSEPLISQITRGSEKYSTFLFSASDTTVFMLCLSSGCPEECRLKPSLPLYSFPSFSVKLVNQ